MCSRESQTSGEINPRGIPTPYFTQKSKICLTLSEGGVHSSEGGVYCAGKPWDVPCIHSTDSSAYAVVCRKEGLLQIELPAIVAKRSKSCRLKSPLVWHRDISLKISYSMLSSQVAITAYSLLVPQLQFATAVRAANRLLSWWSHVRRSS